VSSHGQQAIAWLPGELVHLETRRFIVRSMKPDDLTERAELSVLVREQLVEFRKTLSGKDLRIFDERVMADEPLTLQQLGDSFGVSRERVRQLEARITGRLRDYLRESLGDAVSLEG